VDRGAKRYEEVLAEHGFRYDIILLSSGRTAMWSPVPQPSFYSEQTPWLHRHGRFAKTPPERMTSSLSLMQTADTALILFVGEAKREAYIKFNDASCRLPPAGQFVLGLKDTTVFTDLIL